MTKNEFKRLRPGDQIRIASQDDIDHYYYGIPLDSTGKVQSIDADGTVTFSIQDCDGDLIDQRCHPYWYRSLVLVRKMVNRKVYAAIRDSDGYICYDTISERRQSALIKFRQKQRKYYDPRTYRIVKLYLNETP